MSENRPISSNELDQEEDDELILSSLHSSCSENIEDDDGRANHKVSHTAGQYQRQVIALEMQEIGNKDPCLQEQATPAYSPQSQQGSSCITSFKNQGLVIIYLSAFAIIGSSIRMYLGRLSGLDCEYPPQEKDYISKIATCITATGLTEQRGGALFIDLPANMLGCFLMGIMTPTTTYSNNNNNGETAAAMASRTKDARPIFPCFKHTHRIQRSSTTHLSLTVALCGSMTTFSSWNSQMIAMMVGKNTVLGSQISAAIVGYLIGLLCSVASFSSGRIVGKALYQCRLRDSKTNLDHHYGDDEEDEVFSGKDHDNTKEYHQKLVLQEDANTTNTEMYENHDSNTTGDGAACNIWRHLCRGMNALVHATLFPPFLVSLLLVGFFIGDFKMSSSFHKQLWISSLLSPLGTLLRWKLSSFNGKQQTKRGKDHITFTSCNMGFPHGTFLANQLGCIVSILAVAILSRLNSRNESPATAAVWLEGLKMGFAGNLSTVSTFVKEIVLMADEDRLGLAFSYAMLTVVGSSLVSLVIYILLV